MKVIILVVLILLNLVRSCYIAGTDSGVCVNEPSFDKQWRATNMPFCGQYVQYAACVPKQQTLPPNLEFPMGRWINNTAYLKDQWIGAKAMEHINRQLGFELNKTMKSLNRDIYGHRGHVRKRFTKRLDCQNAFKAMFCYINFPRCYPEEDVSLPTCKSACENFFRTCNYEYGLWRCGPSKWFNGNEPELPANNPDPEGGTIAANLTYLREYMPGQPFRKNKYTLKGNEVPICTPAILGAAGRNNSSTFVNYLLILIVSIVLAISNIDSDDNKNIDKGK